jgi:hypothetical protein
VGIKEKKGRGLELRTPNRKKNSSISIEGYVTLASPEVEMKGQRLS